MTEKELIREAVEAAKMSYSPYSGYKVGAALLCTNGKVYRGCNIESATYSPTNCAERTAFFKAVSEGDKDFEAIAIIGGKDNESDSEKVYFFPCGVCRQVMVEFCDIKSFKIITAKSEEDFVINTLEELMPNMVKPK